MENLLKNTLLCSLLFWQTLSFAGEAFIPLDNSVRLPSNDLVYKGEVLSAEEAAELARDPKKPGNFLELLNPEKSEVWDGLAVDITTTKLDQLPIHEDLEVEFKQSLSGKEGLLKFNILVPEQGEIPSSTMVVLLDKKLHTYLLRKNVLRKLGYKIPAMKYLKKLKINFKRWDEKDFFIKRKIPDITKGSPKRWIIKGLNKDGQADKTLSITLQDIAVTMPLLKDHYNLASDLVSKQLKSRTLRSLIIPYAVFNLNESVNKFSWVAGRIDDDNIVLPHDTIADFETSLDDAKWMLNRFLKLQREDFIKIVELAHFPESVEKLVLEKLISRRNSLKNIFNISGVEDLPVDTDISFGENLEDGRLEKVKYEGYASRFAHGAPDSPFGDWGWGILSRVQSASINGIVKKANEQLQAFDLNDARTDLLKKQFAEGLDHFVNTGTLLEQSVGTWVSPIANGQLIIGRNIIVGNYMGTDNLVQMVDTFGFGFRLGAHLGLDGLGLDYGGFASATLSYVKTYAHLKPVKRLKNSMKEPYKNIIVPLVQKMIINQAERLAYFEDESRDMAQAEKDKLLSEIIKSLDKSLGIGESLIISEKISPELRAGASTSYLGTPINLSIGVSANANFIKRTHLFRRDGKTIQVYVDNGKSLGFGLSFRASKLIPVLEFRYKKTLGKYTVNAYKLNIDSNLKRNPNLLRTSSALSYLLKSGSAELLDDLKRPDSINNRFNDDLGKFKFFFWRYKSLKQSDFFSILSPKFKETNYIRYSNSKQWGINYLNFGKDVANYFIGKYFDGVRIGGDVWRNPGQTFRGMAGTSSGRFSARLRPSSDEDVIIADLDGDGVISYAESEEYQIKEKEALLKRKISIPFIKITHRKEGGIASRDRIFEEIEKWEEKYGTILFPENTLKDAAKLKLYNLSLNINIYEKGIENLKNLSKGTLEKLEKKYMEENVSKKGCGSFTDKNNMDCGSLWKVIWKNRKCQKIKKSNDAGKEAKCLLELAQGLEEDLHFEDFKNIIGDHFYLYGEVLGFREKSEILISPIKSNTMGEVGSKFREGPIEEVRQRLGLQNGEFSGNWMRENVR